MTITRIAAIVFLLLWAWRFKPSYMDAGSMLGGVVWAMFEAALIMLVFVVIAFALRAIWIG